MKNLKNKVWWEAALTRAIKTMAQTCVALAGTNSIYITDINFMAIISASLLAAFISIATSISGLPEVAHKENTNASKSKID